MDITSLVQSINSSFEDASTLVKGMGDRKDGNENADTAVTDLLESLQLGPIVIRGYYASDAKRFGDPYKNGDTLAREELKDVLINLQMTVLTTLRAILVDNTSPDFTAIQTASDDCRVNAGVCLGQLSQRLADPKRAQRPDLSALPITIPTPPLKYSSSRSTHSSDSPRTPTTPEMEAALLDLDIDYPGRLLGFNPHASNLRGKAFAVLQGTNSSPKAFPGSSHSSMESWMKRQMEVDEVMSRRPSSHCLSADDNPIFSPTSPTSTNSPWSRESPVSSGIMSHFGSIIKKKQTSDESFKDRFSPDDYSDVRNSKYSFSTSHRKQPSESSASTHSHRSTRSRKNSPEASPKSQRQHQSITNYSRSRGTPRRSMSISGDELSMKLRHPAAASSNASINKSFVDDEPAPPIPVRSVARQFHVVSQVEPLVLKPGAKKILGDIDPYLDTFLGVLNLPTEDNLLGFCKSAYRLQVNSEKKAFHHAQRPMGFSAMVPFWKCEKCLFEGPLSTITPPSSTGRSKPEKIFDPAIREYDGIRFKWVFLAKCHVPTKSTSTNRHRVDGMSGSFGCIFCAAEGSHRGWFNNNTNPAMSLLTNVTNNNNSNSNGRPTTSSGTTRPSTSSGIQSFLHPSSKKHKHNSNSNTNSNSNSTNSDSDSYPPSSTTSNSNNSGNTGGTTAFSSAPIFGNSHSFMEHLQMHRQRNYWPNKEMQNRTKCIVGRVAGRGEEFDINFMPVGDDY